MKLTLHMRTLLTTHTVKVHPADTIAALKEKLGGLCDSLPKYLVLWLQNTTSRPTHLREDQTIGSLDLHDGATIKYSTWTPWIWDKCRCTVCSDLYTAWSNYVQKHVFNPSIPDGSLVRSAGGALKDSIKALHHLHKPECYRNGIVVNQEDNDDATHPILEPSSSSELQDEHAQDHALPASSTTILNSSPPCSPKVLDSPPSDCELTHSHETYSTKDGPHRKQGKFMVCDHCMSHGLPCNESSVCTQCQLHEVPCIHRPCPDSPNNREACRNADCRYLHTDYLPGTTNLMLFGQEIYAILGGSMAKYLSRGRKGRLEWNPEFSDLVGHRRKVQNTQKALKKAVDFWVEGGTRVEDLPPFCGRECFSLEDETTEVFWETVMKVWEQKHGEDE